MRIIAVIYILISAGVAFAAVETSLDFEARMAITRGEQFLTDHQNADGSWEHDTSLTAQVAMVLYRINPQSRCLPLAEDFLATCPPCPESTLFYLRTHKTPPWEPILFETAHLNGVELLYAQEANLRQFPNAGTGHFDSSLPGRFLAASTPEDWSRLQQLAQTNLKSLQLQSIQQLEWTTRAFYALSCNGMTLDAPWQHTIVTTLLNSQHADGSWGTISDTAAALHIAIFCLLP